MGTIEHRRLFRAEVFTKVSYETTEGPHIKGKAITVDVSSIGAHMIGTQVLPIGAQLLVKFLFESRKTPISVLAKVVWQKECLHQPEKQKKYYSTGIVFEDMSLQDAIMTSDYIFDSATKHQISCEKEIIRKLQKN